MTDKKMSEVFDLPLWVAADSNLIYQNDNGGVIECEYDLDAEAIALAVNSHDKLVEMLEKVVNLLDGYQYPELVAAKALLQAIKGE